jgi:hypothetical protein
MSKLAAKRRILLTPSEFGLDDDLTFSIPWTIWAQLRSMFAKECGTEIAEDSISAEVARTVAEWIILKHVNLAAVDDENPDEFTTPQQVEALGWLTLLTLWGDGEGVAVAEFAEFLRGGAVVIEESE